MVDGDVEDDLATIPLQQLKTICVQMQEAALHAKQPRASVYTGESRSTLYRQREKLKEHDREFAAHPKIDSFFQRTQSGAAPPAPCWCCCLHCLPSLPCCWRCCCCWW